jgi:hypothetical protein
VRLLRHSNTHTGLDAVVAPRGMWCGERPAASISPPQAAFVRGFGVAGTADRSLVLNA